MAKNFNKEDLTLGRSFNIDDITAKVETKNAVKTAIISKKKEDYIIAAALVKSDNSIIIEKKKEIQFEFRNNFINLFKDIVMDLDIMTEEINYLSKVQEVSFVVIASRLKLIKDKKLWINKHESFKEYLLNETNIDYKTALQYIDIVSYFGDKILTKDIEYSKLVPVIPLLKSKIVPDDEKETIKTDIMFSIDKDKRADIETSLLPLKEKYGLNKSKTVKEPGSLLPGAIRNLQAVLPGDPSEEEKEELEKLIKLLQNYLELSES